MALSTSEFKGRFGFGAMRLPMKDGEPDYELCNRILCLGRSDILFYSGGDADITEIPASCYGNDHC